MKTQYSIADFGPCSFCGQGSYVAYYDAAVDSHPTYGMCSCCGAS